MYSMPHRNIFVSIWIEPVLLLVPYRHHRGLYIPSFLPTCSEFASLLIQSAGADDLLRAAEYFRLNFSGATHDGGTRRTGHNV
jgi:hypothetical protein